MVDSARLPAVSKPGVNSAAIGTEVASRDRIAQRASRWLALLFIALALVFAIVAWWSGDSFFFRLATEALIFGAFAMSVDLLLGFTGLLSLGQALFFGLGAYVSAIVLKEVLPSFWLALGATLLIATLAGAVAGVIAIRAKGVYFALITFGLAEVVAKIVFNTRELGGSDGIIGIPVIAANVGVFSVGAANPAGFFFLMLAIVIAIWGALSYLLDTPFGRLMAAVRVNENRVSFLGFDPQRIKLIAFVVAADIAALAGAFYPMLRGFVSPDLMYFTASGNAVITVIVGGVGTLIGPLYGSVILFALRSVIGTITEHHLIAIGLLFMLSVIFLPKGLIGSLHPRLGAWLARREGSS